MEELASEGMAEKVYTSAAYYSAHPDLPQTMMHACSV
jgi:hypothetical protein